MKLWRNVIAVSLSVCLLLTACTSERPPEANQAQPEPPEEKGQTLTVINPASSESLRAEAAVPSEDKNNQYQIQTRLTDFQLLSTTTGLAWGRTQSELRLYLTRDNGQTWTNISPAASVQFPSTPRFGKDIFFIDPLHGWIVLNASGLDDAIVLRTDDGGVTWKVSSFPGADQVEGIYFSNESAGWILASKTSETGSIERVLYATDDGGATFDPIMGVPDPNSFTLERPASAGLGKGTPVSMAFIDRFRGLVSEIEAGQPALYATGNGGETWAKKKGFFDPSKFKTCERFSIGNVSLFEDGSSAWVPVGCTRDEATKFNGYFTQDAGATWTMVPFNLSWQTGFNEELTPTFLTRNEGWTIMGSTAYYTSDQGNHWTPLPRSPKLVDIMADYPEVVKLQFFSSRVGWLLVAKEDQKRSLLLQTRDGGTSWHVL
ncbi:hypothetical protein [Paenibacillus macerans]|uniref:hypothetical protein n=1 Tax=Paenibacillus macerans TaxID=44252 RepID=UPI000EC93B62|nr:hypothetical protein [Paenibacillus macerans]GBK61787.1 hypothetical protein PbDSM24746_17910 [Paenibacillus macerans]GBK68094.1 hypothetical protein PbJCM17693_18020 [Paenibacillus macerans]